ncbi:MAG: AmpG family muropeptide MFS transporter [Pseudobdellovibrionaceae bacterium]
MTEKRNILKDLFSKHMLIIFLLGFSSGLPLLLTGGTLKTWLAREHVDISTIGYFSWVGMAYSLKFLWSPLLDRFTLFKVGRRRSWMLVTQILLMASIYVIGTLNPLQNLSAMAVIAVLIAFFSATQDIAIDAYRREILSNEELGLGSSLGIYGYRIALLLSGGAGIGLVGSSIWPITWGQLYFLMAACMIVGVVTTLFAPEPKLEGAPPRNLKEAIIEPFAEFLKRPGAWFILLFVFMFKLGDALSGAMLNPYYVEVGFSNTDIGLIAKTFGLMSSLVGLFFGGLIIYYIGIFRSLWFFGILQGLSTAAFALLVHTGPKAWALATVVVFEDISSGMGSAAFVAFLGTLSNKKYTATQYAILSSIATLGRNFFSGFTGNMVKGLGWDFFFYVCALIAIPGLLMLVGMRKFQTSENPA